MVDSPGPACHTGHRSFFREVPLAPAPRALRCLHIPQASLPYTLNGLLAQPRRTDGRQNRKREGRKHRETTEGLAAVIHERATSASPEESYTACLLTPEKGDKLLSKLAEESSEIIMACKDEDHDHIRCYEMGDLSTTCSWLRSTASPLTSWLASLTPAASRQNRR